jgi:hypothetical protein
MTRVLLNPKDGHEKIEGFFVYPLNCASPRPLYGLTGETSLQFFARPLVMNGGATSRASLFQT